MYMPLNHSATEMQALTAIHGSVMVPSTILSSSEKTSHRSPNSRAASATRSQLSRHCRSVNHFTSRGYLGVSLRCQILYRT